MYQFKVAIVLLLLLSVMKVQSAEIPTSVRAENSIARVEKGLIKELEGLGLNYGAPIFIRIFKDPGVLEVWIKKPEQEEFKMFKTYRICNFSGDLGPKLKEGDRQSPEGFYFVKPNALNPWSQFHLSFNLGYPNTYDRFHGRTGSALMVHGNCVSIGCYAMTDPYMDEIYALSVAALKTGQSFFRVHIFPFKLEKNKLGKYSNHKWYDFWLNLKEGYDLFEEKRIPPNVEVINGKYVFN